MRYFLPLILLILIPAAQLAAQETTVFRGECDARGILIHNVESPFQSGTTQIRVLWPEMLKPDERLPVVYVLPVEARNETRYGDGLLEVKRLNLHNKHRAIFVAPTFSHLPWYADHPTDESIRQESYLLEVVIPFVEKTYPAKAERNARLLLGFSKSGWGAWSLLLRYPDRFGKAAAWDAPLTKDRPNQFGMEPIFGTQENFERYQVTRLLPEKATALGAENRLILLGYDSFRDHHVTTHELLDRLHIPHIYRDGPRRKHIWESGWLTEAVELLFSQSR